MPYKDLEKRRDCHRLSAQKWRKLDKERFDRATKKWRLKNRDKVLAQKSRWYYKNKVEITKRMLMAYKENKRIVFEHYGGTPPKCSCCNESIFDFLTLDHKNGGGTKHRKEIGASNMLRYIIKNNFPEEFEILCYNCNCSKAFNHSKICPHKI